MAFATELFPGPGYTLTWTDEFGTVTVTAGHVQPSTTGAYSVIRCAFDCDTPDIRLHFLLAAADIDSEVGLFLRCQAGVSTADHSYQLHTARSGTGGAQEWGLFKNVLGVATRIDAGTNLGALAPGSTVTLEINPDTQLITAKLDGVTITSATGADGALTTGKRGGMLLINYVNAPNTAVETLLISDSADRLPHLPWAQLAPLLAQ